MCTNNSSHRAVVPSLEGFSVRISLFYEALAQSIIYHFCSGTMDELVADMPNTNMKEICCAQY